LFVLLIHLYANIMALRLHLCMHQLVFPF
jgi:hypothetical protein